MPTLPSVPGVEHQQVDAGGVELHVATAGPADGHPVVLLHGWPQNWWLWRHQLPALAAAGHRVLAFDLRGFGWSATPQRGYDKEQLAADVLAALDTLGIEEFSAAGHDWGGWVAQLLALHHPRRVRRLAVINITPVFGDTRRTLPNAWRLAYQLPLATPVVGAAVQRSPLLGRMLVGVAPEAREIYVAPFREPDRARAGGLVYRDFLRRDLPASARGAYAGKRLSAPMLVLHGTDDPVVRRSMVEGFRDHADDVRIEWIPGAGHFVVDERPEVVTEHLLEHFAPAA